MAIRTTLPLFTLCLLAACGSNAGGGDPSTENPASLTQAESVSQGEQGDGAWHDLKVRHVVLISVDGLHEADASNWIAGHPKSTLAERVFSL